MTAATAMAKVLQGLQPAHAIISEGHIKRSFTTSGACHGSGAIQVLRNWRFTEEKKGDRYSQGYNRWRSKIE